MTVKLIQVIVTDLELKGASLMEQDRGDVARRITQYWSLEGELLAEVDPYKMMGEKKWIKTQSII